MNMYEVVIFHIKEGALIFHAQNNEDVFTLRLKSLQCTEMEVYSGVKTINHHIQCDQRQIGYCK